MKTRWIVLLCAALLALTACAAPEMAASPAPTASSAATTAAADPTAAPTPAEPAQTPAPTPTEQPEAPYADLLALYGQAAQEGWDMEACDAAGLSLMCGRPEQAWGYALQDLDGDGAPQKLLTGWERNAYVLCEDGTVYNTASGGAAYTVFADYAVREGALVPVKTVVFDTDAWTAYDGAEGEGEGVPLTEEEAQAWMDGHAVQTVEITLLHEAQPLSE